MLFYPKLLDVPYVLFQNAPKGIICIAHRKKTFRKPGNRSPDLVSKAGMTRTTQNTKDQHRIRLVKSDSLLATV